MMRTGLDVNKVALATGMLLIINVSSFPVEMGNPLRRFPQPPSLGKRAHLLTTDCVGGGIPSGTCALRGGFRPLRWATGYSIWRSRRLHQASCHLFVSEGYLDDCNLPPAACGYDEDRQRLGMRNGGIHKEKVSDYCNLSYGSQDHQPRKRTQHSCSSGLCEPVKSV